MIGVRWTEQMVVQGTRPSELDTVTESLNESHTAEPGRWMSPRLTEVAGAARMNVLPLTDAERFCGPCA